MLSKRPYLIRALYDWTVDQGHVPIIVVDATVSGVLVPQAHVEEGQIHLNISPNAVRYFVMDKSSIAFEARFAGKPETIFVPMRAIIGIYDRDSGSGAQFPNEPDEDFPGEDEQPAAPPKLSLAGAKAVPKRKAKTPLESVSTPAGAASLDESAADEPPPEPPTPNAPPKRARLRVVK
jgi:stringent starvation protein B